MTWDIAKAASIVALVIGGIAVTAISSVNRQHQSIGEANARAFLTRLYPNTPTNVVCTTIPGQICRCAATRPTASTSELSRPFTLRCSCENPNTGCFLEQNQ